MKHLVLIFLALAALAAQQATDESNLPDIENDRTEGAGPFTPSPSRQSSQA